MTVFKITRLLPIFVFTSILISSCSTKAPTPGLQKPTALIAPVVVIGEISTARKKILQNTLHESLSGEFRIVSEERFEKAQEQASQELDDEECTEDPCIMLIQELLQVEHLFKLEVIQKGRIIQFNLKLSTLHEKKNKTDFCKKCTTRQLRDRVSTLTKSLIEEIETSGVAVLPESRPAIKKKIGTPSKRIDPEKSDQLKRKTMLAREAELQPQEPETEKEDQTNVTKNFRIRTLGGYSSSNSTNVVSGTISFSWNGLGLGFSNLAYKKKSPSFVYDMKASFYELSYTLGQNWSLGLAVGLVGNGMGNIDTSDARYETIKTSGAYYTGVLGGAIAGFEGLLGYQALQLKYSDLKNNADGSSLSTPFEIKGGLFLFGLGFQF